MYWQRVSSVRRPGTSRSWLAALLACSLLLCAAGCGDESTPALDASIPDNRLVIASPGDDVGLSYNERITLGVRYQTEFGEPLGNRPVDFALVSSGPGEHTAGSVLSATSANTDAAGLAQVDLVAGAANASFRVSADARDAPTRFFYIEISDGGFARVSITPTHQGWRPDESFSRVEVRLYPSDELTCLAVDIDELPVAVSPPRSLDGFGGTVAYQSVAAGQAQTVVAWAEAAGASVPVSAGCVDLGALPPSPVELGLVLRDRPLLAAASPVLSGLDLTPIAQELDALGATRPWQTLGCAAGPGQLLLDCALDGAVPDGALDCQIAASGGLISAVAPRRGTLDANGCRALVDGSGMPSLDALASDAVALGASFPTAGDLATMVQTRDEMVGTWQLASRLESLASGALAHELVRLDISATAGDFTLDLGATSRPVVRASPIAAEWQGQDLGLAEHGFTLRAGRAAADAFAALGLEPQGLAARRDDLGRALVDSVRHAASAGCPALSQLVCTDIGQSGTCLLAGCEAGATALDARLAAWWRALDTTGLDFRVAGQVRALDDDGDRVIESVAPAPDPSWRTTLTLSDGRTLPLPTTLE